MDVVCYIRVCYERVCYERVCYERGLLWTWSVMNVVCYERGLLWTGLLRTGLFRKDTIAEHNLKHA